MPKVDEEELLEIEASARHEQVTDLLKVISGRKDINLSEVERILGRMSAAITALAQKKNDIDLKPIAKEISDGVTALNKTLSVRPKSFRIERSKVGWIERIIPEY